MHRHNALLPHRRMPIWPHRCNLTMSKVSPCFMKWFIVYARHIECDERKKESEHRRKRAKSQRELTMQKSNGFHVFIAIAFAERTNGAVVCLLLALGKFHINHSPVRHILLHCHSLWVWAPVGNCNCNSNLVDSYLSFCAEALCTLSRSCISFDLCELEMFDEVFSSNWSRSHETGAALVGGSTFIFFPFDLFYNCQFKNQLQLFHTRQRPVKKVEFLQIEKKKNIMFYSSLVLFVKYLVLGSGVRFDWSNRTQAHTFVYCMKINFKMNCLTNKLYTNTPPSHIIL